MSFRILVTGSRDWTDRQTIIDAFLDLNEWRPIDWDDVVVVHGDCPTGADHIADVWARSVGLKVEAHPADWSIGKKAGPLRNKKMVDLGADIVLAFPKGESRGTRGCIKLAQEAGLEVKIYEGEKK